MQPKGAKGGQKYQKLPTTPVLLSPNRSGHVAEMRSLSRPGLLASRAETSSSPCWDSRRVMCCRA